MSIKSVRKYQSDDGKLHDSMQEAYKHNAQFKILDSMRNLLADSAATTQTLPITLLNNPKIAAEVRDQMNKILDYHRRYTGKVKKKES